MLLKLNFQSRNRCLCGWRKRQKHFKNDPELLVDFIYSPDGFFAVWDAFISNYQYMVEFVMLKHESHECFLTKFFIDDSPIRGEGKDRYSAFYNAIYKAMKDE